MFDSEKFFSKIRELFGSLDQGQVDGFNRTIEAMKESGLDVNSSAYVLATFWHETGTRMQPITELGSRSYIERRYDPVAGSTTSRRKRARAMGNTSAGDGWKYRGRGPVQVTWKVNYRKLAPYVGLTPQYGENHPEYMLDPNYAYKASVAGMVHGVFTGAKLSHYVNATKADFVQARRVVNGTDRAQLIAEYAQAFRKVLLEAAGRLK